MYTIYHNPRCRKSRETLSLLKEHIAEKDIEIVEYLNDVPDKSTMTKLIEMLGIPAEKLLRKGEADFKSYKGQTHNDSEWIDIMLNHPKLIERPIVVKGKQAVIGRPPENVKSLF